MAKDKDPAFLFYPKDWLEGTAEYMPDEKGVYIDLLCHQHQKGSLPSDTIRLARIVGLPHDEFLRLWKAISANFKQLDDRMVNPKLSRITEERKVKGKLNTITGTFAGLLRLGNFSKKEYLHLKKSFKPSDFIEIPKETITDRLTDWIELCLKSIATENGNENGNNTYSNVVKNLYREIEIFFDENCRPKTESVINKWLDTLDKLIRIDGYDPEHIINITKRARMDDFWRTNFLSINKLREKNKDGISYFTVFEKKLINGTKKNIGADTFGLTNLLADKIGVSQG